MYGVTVGGDLPEFYDLLKQNAEYIYGATQWERRRCRIPGSKEFFAAYKKEFKPRAVLPLGGRATPAASSTREAVKRAGTLDADKVRDAAAQAGDQDGVRRLQGRPGRLPDRAQDGHAPVAGRQEGRWCGRTSWPTAKPRYPDAALEPAVALRDARPPDLRRALARVRRPVSVLITPSMIGPGGHLRPPGRRALRDGGAGAGADLRGHARHQRRPRAAPHAGRLHHVLALQPGRAESVPLAAGVDAAAVRGRRSLLQRTLVLPRGGRARAVLAAADLRRSRSPW